MVFENDDLHPFFNKELNNLVRNFGLLNDTAELLASRLKENDLLSDKNGDCQTNLCQTFPGLTTENLEAGIFDVLRSVGASDIQSSKTQ